MRPHIARTCPERKTPTGASITNNSQSGSISLPGAPPQQLMNQPTRESGILLREGRTVV